MSIRSLSPGRCRSWLRETRPSANVMRARQQPRLHSRGASENDGGTVFTGAIGINGPTGETAAGRGIRGYRTERGRDLNVKLQEDGDERVRRSAPAAPPSMQLASGEISG